MATVTPSKSFWQLACDRRYDFDVSIKVEIQKVPDKKMQIKITSFIIHRDLELLILSF